MKQLILFCFILLSASLSMALRESRDRGVVPEIPMNQFMIASAVDFPAIQTYGVATCIAVVIYDSELQLGAIAHISASTKITTSLKTILSQFTYLGGNLKKTTVHLFGGWGPGMDGETGTKSTSPLMLAEVKKFLKAKKIPVVYEDTLYNGRLSPPNKKSMHAIELDLWTGEVSEYIENTPYIKNNTFNSDWTEKYFETSVLQPHSQSL